MISSVTAICVLATSYLVTHDGVKIFEEASAELDPKKWEIAFFGGVQNGVYFFAYPKSDAISWPNFEGPYVAGASNHLVSATGRFSRLLGQQFKLNFDLEASAGTFIWQFNPYVSALASFQLGLEYVVCDRYRTMVGFALGGDVWGVQVEGEFYSPMIHFTSSIEQEIVHNDFYSIRTEFGMRLFSPTISPVSILPIHVYLKIGFALGGI